MIGGWQSTFGAILYTLHEGTCRMAGNVNPLRPIFQGQAETAPFPFRFTVDGLQPEQICQPGADAVMIAFSALIV